MSPSASGSQWPVPSRDGRLSALRPFALGICIMLFPTLVLGTMNSGLSPIVQGTHHAGRADTGHAAVQAQKDRLEREAMMRNPENRLSGQ